MILIFIFISITLLGIGGIIVYEHSYKAGDEWQIIGAVFATIGGILTVISGGVCILKNCPYALKIDRERYNLKVEQLNNSYELILNNNDESYSIAITSYNEQVREFKNDIITNQIALKNPWINWFYSKAYKEFDVDAVKYITVYTGK